MSKKEHKDTRDKHEEMTPSEENNSGQAAVQNPVTPSLSENVEKEVSEETGDVETRLEELNDKYLRLYSDFDNYRKRSLKEILDIRKYASEDVVVRLLAVLDDFERAIKAFDTTENAQALKDGVILIFNKFMTILTGLGLEQMKTVGETFNTDFHEAITSIPVTDEEMKNKVVDEIEKGYLLNGKVIRYARVVVGA